MTTSRSAPPADLTAAVMTVCAFAVFLALTRTLIAPASADLTALWLAGQFLAEGRPDLVYPADATLFTMLPPPEWFARQAAAGQPGDVFPYLYPPLWAALAANLSPHASLVAVLAVAGWINPALLAGCFILAWRIAGRPLRPDIWLAAGLTFAMFTSVGLIAIGQDQPQILVAFLTLLALERAESGAPHAAGAALALAAAIKLFPALLVIFWLGRDRRAALAAFAVAGAALALLSVALAGWPLHRDFLRIIRAVSATGLVTNLSYSLDATLGQLAYTDRIAFIRSPARDPALGDRAGWNVYAKPAALGLALLAAQIATLALAARALARAAGPATRAAIMAAALTFATLLGPVGWSYYYIAPAAFLPLLLTRFGALSGLAVMVLIALPVCVAMSILNPALPGILRPLQLFGVVAMMVMGAAFLSLARRTRG